MSVMKKEKKNKSVSILLLSFKIVAWAVMAIILFIAGILMGAAGLLTPDRLTPLVERIATQSLQNAEVKLDRVELTVVGTFPFVHADIEGLTILSTVRSSLDEETSEFLPEYTDTVLTVRGFSGGMNIMKLFAYQLDFSDVIIDHPAANLVIIDEETTNFDIIPAKKEEDEKPFNINEMPGISLKRFAIIDPGKIRFYNNDTQTELSAAFTQVSLDGSDAPLYTLNFDGNIEAPSEFLDIFNIPDLRFGLNGSMTWSQENPELLTLEDFEFLFSIFGGTISTEVNFADGVTFNILNVRLIPLDVMQMIRMVPEDIAEEFGIPSPGQLDTDAKLNIAFSLDKPWNIASDTISPFTLRIDIPSCRFNGFDLHTQDLSGSIIATLVKPWAVETEMPELKADIRLNPMALTWDRLRLITFETDLSAYIPDGNIMAATIDIWKLILKGPSTDLSLKGKISRLIDDPTFDGSIEGSLDFSRLPRRIINQIDGSISGKVTTRIALKGSQSMLNTENFHRLNLKGDVALENVYFVSGDTVNMFDIHRAMFHFGTSEQISRRNEVKADSLLRVSLNIDTALILHSDIAMNLSKFNISLAAQNTSERLKKGRINPMGGSISLKTFNLLKTNDSTIVRLRDLKGYTVLKAYNNDIRTPQFIFDINVGRVAAGDNETRILLNNASTHLDARRVAKTRSAKRFSQIADSIHFSHPDLPPDSVIKYALEIHNRHRSKYPRVHERYETSDSLDVLDWGASPLFKRMLNLWTFEGSLKSHRAGLFTPYMPLRNRFRNIDVHFNNDSITINNLQYKIGHSDFTVNGVMSNMRKAFTSSDFHQPLKINFEVLSDTIDINQLTEAMMAGSAYSATPEEKRHHGINNIEEDEENLEEHIARLTENAPDTVMPILIPQNLDAELNMRSNHVRYSDFEMQNMNGHVLTYDGALNLQNLSATSPVGNIRISALYSALHPDNLRFGFGLQLTDFNLHRFLKLVPAVDSLLPVMRDFSGIISADIAATSDVDRNMNLVIPTLDAAIGIKGDSLVLLDPETFKSLSKWLLFKDKKRNIIDHLDVQMIVKDNQVDVYPFIFDFDRYKLGIQGYNDFDLKFNYHIAVLKSPIPFKFGINISGDPDKYKIRLGGAKFGEQQIRQVAIVDTTRVNLMNEIHNVFKRGARDARLARLKVDTKPLAAGIDLSVDSLTHADSLRYIKEGLIDAPIVPPTENRDKGKRKKGSQPKTAQVENYGNSSHSLYLLPMVAVLNASSNRRRKI